MTDSIRPSSGDDGRSSSSVLKPVPFDAPQATRPKPAGSAQTVPDRNALLVSSDSPWWHSQFKLMLCAFAVLAVLGLASIALAPAPQVSGGASIRVSADGAKQAVETTVAPFEESLRAAARTDSQDILADLLTVKKQLEGKQVSTWAASAYQAALQKAQEGDDLYAQQDFVAAIENYRAALQQMDGLLADLPKVLKGIVAQGNSAIAEGKVDVAIEKFELALQLDRNSIPALEGLERARTLGDSLRIVQAAQSDEAQYQKTGDLQSLQTAKAKFDQVLELDPQLQIARDGLARVVSQLSEHNYRAAMSDGFAALFAGQSRNAKAAFATALELKPDDSVANSLYRQSLASDSRASLSSILAGAESFERQERWANAVSNYKIALQRDSNQIKAKLGLIRSQARSELDQQLKIILADPLGLSRAGRKAEADKALADARALSKRGAVLNDQIAQLETLIDQLAETVTVQLASDQLTQVSLHKLGSRNISLGRFEKKSLALKPGRYVLNGARLGFQDVRQELDILPGMNSLDGTISVVCEQPLGGTALSKGNS